MLVGSGLLIFNMKLLVYLFTVEYYRKILLIGQFCLFEVKNAGQESYIILQLTISITNFVISNQNIRKEIITNLQMLWINKNKFKELKKKKIIKWIAAQVDGIKRYI